MTGSTMATGYRRWFGNATTPAGYRSPQRHMRLSLSSMKTRAHSSVRPRLAVLPDDSVAAPVASRRLNNAMEGRK